MKEHNGKNWVRIAEYFDGRTDAQCLHRWQKVLNPNLVKGPWTPEVRRTWLPGDVRVLTWERCRRTRKCGS